MKLKLFKGVGVAVAVVLFVFSLDLFAATTDKDLSLDDGTGDSPRLILQDEGDKTLTLQKMDAGQADIISNEGVINLKPSNDTDDYLYLLTATNLVGLFYKNAALGYTNDPGIRINSSGQLEYRDQDGASYTTFDSISGGATNFGDLSDVSLSSLAQGDIAYYNGSNWVNLEYGASGYYLQTQGTGANPQWAAAGGGDITAVGSMTTGDAFAGSGADDDWLGLGASAGRIEFDDQVTDEVNILDANVGIGVTDPDTKLEVFNAGDQLKLSYDADSFATFALDASDDLTIKPAASGGVRLQPTTTDTTDFFQVLDQDGGTAVFNVDATNERVGIGTAAPDNLLEVSGGDAKIYVTGTSGCAIYLKETSGTTTWAEWQKGDAGIRLNIDDGSTTRADVITVENGGDVGIGDSTPDVKLEVAGQIRVKGDTPGNSGGYAFTSPGDTDGGMFSTADGLLEFYTNNAERMRINSSGDVGIGASPSYRLDVQDSNTGSDGFVARIYNTDTGATSDGLLIRLGQATPSNSNEFIGFYAGDGSWIAEIDGNGAGGVTYNTGSDRRMKENIRDTKYSVDDLMKVQVRDFNMINNDVDTTGFIAQELYEIYPDAVSAHFDNDEMWGVDYGRITPLLVKAIQDQQEQIDAQQKAIAAMEARLAKLERR